MEGLICLREPTSCCDDEEDDSGDDDDDSKDIDSNVGTVVFIDMKDFGRPCRSTSADLML